MLNKIHLLICLIIVLSVTMVSCKDGGSSNSDYIENKNGFVRITVNIPSAAIPKKNTLRSGQIPPEAEVYEVQVMVFENGLYSYTTPGLNIDQSTGDATFFARLRSSNVPTTLYLVANNNDFVNANEPITGTPIEEVKTHFNLSYTTNGVNGNSVLWGSYLFETGISASLQYTANPIPLLRAVARVDVEVAPDAATHFRLRSIQVFRASSKIQMIPNALSNGTSVADPSIPSGSQNNINTNRVNTVSEILSQSQVYLPESAAPSQSSDATCVVVGGFYEGSVTESFYRLDFNPNGDGLLLGQILRNHRYVFSINEVGNAGFATPEEAANSTPVALNATLLVWNDSDHLNIYFDDNDFFALDKRAVDLAGMRNSTAQISVTTSVPSYEMRFVEPVQTAWATSLNDGALSVTQTNGGRTLVFTALESNVLYGETKKQTLEIRANDVNNIFISITQEPITIEWATTNVAAFRVFAAGIQDAGNLYQWNRTTSFPVTGTISWLNTIDASLVWVAANNPCPIGWRIPTYDEWSLFRIIYPGLSIRSDGGFYGPTQEEADNATYADPGRTIFLRDNIGIRGGTTGGFVAGVSQYVVSDRFTDGRMSIFRIGQSLGLITGTAVTTARSVRCVRSR